MSELSDQVKESVEKSPNDRLNTAIALLVSLTASFMAICNVKDGNIVQAMMQSQSRAVDTWSFYQSKSTKQHLTEHMVDELKLVQELFTGMTPAAKATVVVRLVEYTKSARRYENEKEDIRRQAVAYQKEYDQLNIHDDQFDMAEASLSVALAIYGITALTRKRFLLVFAILMMMIGTVMGVAGFAGWTIHSDLIARFLG